VNDLKSSDLLDNLVSEAQSIAAERAEILGRIQKENQDLAAAEQLLTTARARVADEEFAAAQVEGGLAVASKAAGQAVVELGLKVKSVRFRTRGLQTRLEQVEHSLQSVWERMVEFNAGYKREKLASLGEEFEAAIRNFLSLLCRARALKNHLRHGEFECISTLNAIYLANPVTRVCYVDRGFLRTDRSLHTTLEHAWAHDAVARELDESLSAIKERLAPVETWIKEISGGQQS